MCASGKNIARDEHGARIQDNRAIEVTLERSMARRRRVPQDPDALAESLSASQERNLEPDDRRQCRRDGEDDGEDAD